MAKAIGPTNYPVINELLAHPRSFSFFQVVRLLEKFTRGVPIGHQGPPRSEPMRFRGWNTLQFPTCDVQEVEEEDNPWGTPAKRYNVTAAFMGLYGAVSPIPTNYSELIVKESDVTTEEDRARLRAFFDIFNHRLLSLLYRTITKYRYHFLYQYGGVDSFSHYIFCLIGRGTAGMPNKGRPIDAFRMMRYAGLLTQHPKSAAGLRGLVADFFEGIPTRIEQCVGRWLNVEDVNRLGQANCALGESMILGSQVNDRMGKFRVTIGPVGFKQFLEFLPNGSRIKELKELVRLYLLDELDFDVEILLRGDEVPSTIMATKGLAPMLGWTTFVVDGPGPDRSLIFNLR